MIEYYPQIKSVHVGAVILIGSLFLARGLLLIARQNWAMAAPLRNLSYSIDIVLLTAALMLLSVLPSALFANGWLWVKIGLLVCYIVLGIYAFRPARTRWQRKLSFAMALGVFATMYSVARTHHPLGFLTTVLT